MAILLNGAMPVLSVVHTWRLNITFGSPHRHPSRAGRVDPKSGSSKPAAAASAGNASAPDLSSLYADVVDGDTLRDMIGPKSGCTAPMRAHSRNARVRVRAVHCVRDSRPRRADRMDRGSTDFTQSPFKRQVWPGPGHTFIRRGSRFCSQLDRTRARRRLSIQKAGRLCPNTNGWNKPPRPQGWESGVSRLKIRAFLESSPEIQGHFSGQCKLKHPAVL